MLWEFRFIQFEKQPERPPNNWPRSSLHTCPPFFVFHTVCFRELENDNENSRDGSLRSRYRKLNRVTPVVPVFWPFPSIKIETGPTTSCSHLFHRSRFMSYDKQICLTDKWGHSPLQLDRPTEKDQFLFLCNTLFVVNPPTARRRETCETSLPVVVVVRCFITSDQVRSRGNTTSYKKGCVGVVTSCMEKQKPRFYFWNGISWIVIM